LACPPDVRFWGNIRSAALPSYELLFKRVTLRNKRADRTRESGDVAANTIEFGS
jgi:hypothetical protein